jgi:MoaE-MoaD fusion protein
MSIQITVRYLGGAKSSCGCAEEPCTLPRGARVADAVAKVVQEHPSLRPFLPSLRWALNYDFVELDTPLADGDELAAIPPMQGGVGDIKVTSGPLDAQAVLDALADPEIGASVLFMGTVRRHSQGKEVQQMEYEAYVPMVEKSLATIVRELEQSYPETRIIIHHRYGQLQIGDIAVLIGTASPHREAAYNASRDAIERLKVDVAIWKKETTTDGECWVGWGGG